jgi:hypothetical protein
MRAGATLTLALALSLGAFEARAQSAEDALLGECFSLRTAGRFTESLARCEQAVSTARSGRSLGQLALTEMALERWPDAARHLTDALADGAHPWVVRNRATLTDALRTTRARVAELLLDANEAGVRYRIDGRDRGEAQGGVFVLPGTATLEARTPDGRTLSRSVTLSAGGTSRESFAFERPVAPTVSTTVAPPVAPVRTVPNDRPGPPLRALAFASAGVAAAGFTLALLGWRLREGAVGDYVARCPSGETTDPMVAARCASLHTDAERDLGRWQTLSTAGIITGSAFAIASAVLFVVSPSTRSTGASALSCAVSVTSPGLHCAVVF